MINVAFITLLERKVLGYRQLRKGPNKVGFGGVVQPFNDAIKLFTKENINPRRRNKIIFILSPVIGIILRLRIWISIPNSMSLRITLSLIFIYIVMRINIYPLIISGWSSNSNYAIIGALRGVAQTISYEIRFALLILFVIIICGSIRIYSVVGEGNYIFKSLIFFPVIGLWLISSVAETNRTPFDFAEGESELVSGFNVEYGSGGFALIFIAEYARIYFMSVFFCLIFLMKRINTIILPLMRTFLVFFWIWLRCTLPRYRYDILISLAWFSILPASLYLLFYLNWVYIF